MRPTKKQSLTNYFRSHCGCFFFFAVVWIFDAMRSVLNESLVALALINITERVCTTCDAKCLTRRYEKFHTAQKSNIVTPYTVMRARKINKSPDWSKTLASIET